MPNVKISKSMSRFLRDEDGSATILALLFTMIFIVMGGVAVDFNKAVSERTQLRIAADTAAHAALYTRENEGAATAKTVAINTINGMLPAHQFGTGPITFSDMAFGSWDFETRAFTEDSGSRKAVRVVAEMNTTRGNASRNLLLGIIGTDTFDINIETVYTTYYPPCFTEGFVADDVVDIQSNNSFTDGFCIHSNNYVSLNSNNYFEPGTVVSMPSLNDLDIPNSGFEKNEGLQTALRTGEYRMRLLAKLPDIIDSFWAGSSENLPEFVTGSARADVSMHPDFGNGKTLNPDHFEPNMINFLYCSGAGKLTLSPGVYAGFVFVSDCEVKFANGVILEEVVIATTSSSASSLNSPQGLQLGRNDNCAPGGGATLMTLGGFNAASSLSVYNGQILALGDIEFAANADGIQGASFVSMSQIDGTSNMAMGFCNGNGMENAYRAPYFRMVR